MKQTIKQVMDENVKPFFMYTGGMGALNGAMTYLANDLGMDELISDVSANLTGIAAINAVYTPVVTYGVKLGEKINKKHGGTIAANLISLGTSLGFYAYALATNEGDPTAASAVQGAVGLGLTNYHAIRNQNLTSESLEEKIEDSSLVKQS